MHCRVPPYGFAAAKPGLHTSLDVVPPAAGGCHTPLRTYGGAPQATGADETHCAVVCAQTPFVHVIVAPNGGAVKPKLHVSVADAPFLLHAPFSTVGRAARHCCAGGGGGVPPPLQNGLVGGHTGGGGGPNGFVFGL